MLTGVAAFLLLLIALLAIPLTLTFQASWPQASQGFIMLHWAFGLVSVRMALPQSKAPSTEGDELTRKLERSQTLSGEKRNAFIRILRQQSFRRRVIRFIRDFWHAIHKRDVILRLRIGLGDPADTGQLWSVVGPVAGILATIKEASLVIEPEFFDTTFELDGSGSIRFIPLHIIGLTVGILLSPSVWQGIGQMRQVER